MQWLYNRSFGQFSHLCQLPSEEEVLSWKLKKSVPKIKFLFLLVMTTYVRYQGQMSCLRAEGVNFLIAALDQAYKLKKITNLYMRICELLTKI